MQKKGKRTKFSACKFYRNQLKLNATERRDEASQPIETIISCSHPNGEDRKEEEPQCMQILLQSVEAKCRRKKGLSKSA